MPHHPPFAGSPPAMSRPAGDPGALAAGARGMSAAAGALRDVGGRLRGATSFVVVAGAWKGPASEAFLVDGAGQQAALGRAADALDQAAGALSELSARLEHAQSTWDRAQRLAASAGVALDGPGAVDTLRSAWNPHGGVRSPADAVDPAAMLVGGQAVRMAEAAEHEAAAARRAAAARFDQAATGPPGTGPRRPRWSRAGRVAVRGRVGTVAVRRATGEWSSGWWAGCSRRGPRWRRRPITWSRRPRRGSRRRSGWPGPPTTRRCGRRPAGSPRRPGGR